MIMVDAEIEAAVSCGKIGITPFFAENVNPCSYDLHLGEHFWVENKTKILDPYSQQSIRDNFYDVVAESLVIKPGGFLLGTSVETVRIPDDCVGLVVGKSSVARLGWGVENAGLLDPGFEGQVTFEIFNLHDSDNKLYANMRFAQVYFLKTKACKRPYGSRKSSKYQHQEGATLSKFYKNVVSD